MQIEFTVNGKMYNLTVSPTLRLIDLLREELGLTGTKEGCGEGECGSCTVIINGKAVNSCLVLASQIRGQEILTIEALETDGLDKLQESFIKNSAVQCGFCTPGMLMSAKALLMKNPTPSEEEIKTAIAGNLCRCTGYNKIVQAIKEAAE
ncbi:(2Fe-2S)-binding protein [Desulfosporosinus hippei]|uniref:Carbon-monoxide dehydrogenase small subunit n=1 Tax=Desulfosporosinus hippei DSM 8344 TaxID=1121419 RepID=A0A1G7YGW4_9FIRM|nr:(2Fe-2S)-binding protein [Desulfosporosinus hippei]SDG95594.1 carbon-monoxide dehydrogenase small subunit [Desulfosporosinus hippei DSM 8344]